MSSQEKKRLLKIVKGAAAIFAVGLLYYIFSRLTHITLPCVFYEISGLYCPGCGLTRMCYALLAFDFGGAAKSNLLLFSLLPFLAAFGIRRAIIYVKKGKSDTDMAEAVFFIAVGILALAFFILRNTERFSFLAPV